MPPLVRTVRFRLAVLSSAALFLVVGVLLVVLYSAVSSTLDSEPVTREVLLTRRFGDLTVVQRAETIDVIAELEREFRRDALDDLRRLTLALGVVLFPVSVLIGWLVAGRLLAPVDRITMAAREIEASGQRRRIALEGPDDELKRLADTFDHLLDGLDEHAERQRRFVQNASHELRNPLAVLSTNLDVALRHGDDDPRVLRERVEVARRTVDRIGSVVDDLITFGRQQGGGEREPVVLGDLVADLAAEYRSPAEERGLHLVVRAEPDLEVSAHAEGLRRAVGNLVDNAVRLAPPGTEVLLGAGRRGTWVWLGVRDRGPGLAADQHHLVFQRFWRTDDGGSGLGLAIVRQVAQSHAGAVALSSRPGAGSSFVVWIPDGGDGPAPIDPDPLATDLAGDGPRSW